MKFVNTNAWTYAVDEGFGMRKTGETGTFYSRVMQSYTSYTCSKKGTPFLIQNNDKVLFWPYHYEKVTAQILRKQSNPLSSVVPVGSLFMCPLTNPITSFVLVWNFVAVASISMDLTKLFDAFDEFVSNVSAFFILNDKVGWYLVLDSTNCPYLLDHLLCFVFFCKDS